MNQAATERMTVRHIRNEGWRWVLFSLEDSMRHVPVSSEQADELNLRVGDVVTFVPEGLTTGTFVSKIDPQAGEPIAPLKPMDIA